MKCPACGHTHSEWSHDLKKMIDEDTEEFKSLPVKNLYACPECGCVLYHKY